MGSQTSVFSFSQLCLINQKSFQFLTAKEVDNEKPNGRIHFFKEEDEATRPLKRSSPNLKGRPLALRVGNKMLHLSSTAGMDFPPRDLGVEQLLDALPRSSSPSEPLSDGVTRVRLLL